MAWKLDLTEKHQYTQPNGLSGRKQTSAPKKRAFEDETVRITLEKKVCILLYVNTKHMLYFTNIKWYQ